MTASVSVVIPAYRSAQTIARALASVAAQTIKPLEAIVIDDGSNDGTFEAALACKDHMNGVELVVLRQENKGAGAARNAGLRAAKGDWLAFLDADDEWSPQKIERSLAHAEGATLVAHDYIEVKNGRETVMDCGRHLKASDDPFEALMLRGFIPSITVLAKRNDVLGVGGFEESLPAAQDYDLWLKLLCRPHAKLVMFPEALARYTVTGTGITSKVEQRRQCSLAVMARHAHALKRKRLRLLLSRVAFVHYEALMAHFERKESVSATVSLLKLPLSALSAAFLALPKSFPAWLALGWIAMTMTLYYFYNFGYYRVKIGTFLSYFLRLS